VVRVRHREERENREDMEHNGATSLSALSDCNQGQYENTVPASGPRYAPDVEKGKGEGEA
jgi:hypothetical protein